MTPAMFLASCPPAPVPPATARQLDAHLRAHGFRIHARPRRGPALWRKGRRVLPELAALAAADAEYHWKHDACVGA